jgi:hypothetical protein
VATGDTGDSSDSGDGGDSSDSGQCYYHHRHHSITTVSLTTVTTVTMSPLSRIHPSFSQTLSRVAELRSQSGRDLLKYVILAPAEPLLPSIVASVKS